MKHGPTNTRWLKEYRSKLSLSEFQKDFLVGALLGDGHIRPSKSGLLAKYQVCHAVRFAEYVDWKYKIWSSWTLTGPTFDPHNNSVVLRTIFHPELATWRKFFYEDRKKVVPGNICELLTNPLSLAIWFMDDGNGDKRVCRLRLSTYAFGRQGNELLQKCLMRNFSLKATIITDCKGSYLYFMKDSALALYKLIRSYILPCMEYKFVKVKSSLTP